MKNTLRRLLASLALALAMSSAFAVGAVEVYRDPSCGCCGSWVNYLQAQGYAVNVHMTGAMAEVKARHGVPMAAASCHTALVDGYVIEGHVPVADIRRLLAERPDAVGLAAPGMPMGSPGMEMGAPERYDVMLIGRDGALRVWASHGPGA